jgi:hypothetical protein
MARCERRIRPPWRLFRDRPGGWLPAVDRLRCLSPSAELRWRVRPRDVSCLAGSSVTLRSNSNCLTPLSRIETQIAPVSGRGVGTTSPMTNGRSREHAGFSVHKESKRVISWLGGINASGAICVESAKSALGCFGVAPAEMRALHTVIDTFALWPRRRSVAIDVAPKTRDRAAPCRQPPKDVS